MKVILHVSELSRLNVAISNANNLLNDRANAQVNLVLNSEAVKSLVDESMQESIAALNKRNVCITACNNALKSNNINLDELDDFVQVVPAGIVYIAQLQYNGFAYIKP